MGKVIGSALTVDTLTSDLDGSFCPYPKPRPRAFKKFERRFNDCLSIVVTERQKLNLKPLPDVSWVYDQYPTVESHPPNLVADLLKQHCTPREGAIQHGDLLCLRMGREANLGMAYNQEGEIWVLYASENGATHEPLHRRIIRCVESVWWI